MALTAVAGLGGGTDTDNDDDVPQHDALMDAGYDGVGVECGACLGAGDANEDVNGYHVRDYEHVHDDDYDEKEVMTQPNQ